MSEQFSKLLSEFKNYIGLEELNFAQENLCLLGIDDYVLEISLQGPNLSLSANLGTVPEEQKEKYYARLLRANYYLLESRGASLAVNPINQEIQIIYNVPIQVVDFNMFTNIVENFLNNVDYWKDVLTKLGAECDESQDFSDNLQHGIRV